MAWKRCVFRDHVAWQNDIPLLVSSGLQGLSLPIACVGSGNPVRVLCLYTTNTLNEV